MDVSFGLTILAFISFGLASVGRPKDPPFHFGWCGLALFMLALLFDGATLGG